MSHRRAGLQGWKSQTSVAGSLNFTDKNAWDPAKQSGFLEHHQHRLVTELEREPGFLCPLLTRLWGWSRTARHPLLARRRREVSTYIPARTDLCCHYRELCWLNGLFLSLPRSDDLSKRLKLELVSRLLGESLKSPSGPSVITILIIDLPPTPAPRSKKINSLVSFNKTKCAFQWLVVYSSGSMRTSTPCAQQLHLPWHHYSPESLIIEDIQKTLVRPRGVKEPDRQVWNLLLESATICQSRPLSDRFLILVHNGSYKWLRLDNEPFLSVTCSCNPRLFR